MRRASPVVGRRLRAALGPAVLVALAGLPGIAFAQSPPASGGGRQGGPPVQGAEPAFPLVSRFDRNGDMRLDRAERTAARDYLTANPDVRTVRRSGRGNTRTGSPGPRLSTPDVTRYPASVSLYDPTALRTLFLQFEHDDWEQELEAFYHTDVEVAATLTVDGTAYRDVGVSFRGNNSFTAVPAGLKRPLTISLDFAHDQNLLGHTELKLLNANQDPTFLRTVLFLDVSRDYMPALKANFVRVVINGESWGVYVSQQAFDKSFTREAFGATGGTRWKSPNNSVGGGLGYLGDDINAYRRWYEMKGKDNVDAWRRLVELCRVLNTAPPEQLERALEPILDVDGALRYLALDVALANADGYWRDGSDFNLYLDEKGRFHITFHDVNEGFRSGGRGGSGATPEPLAVLDDTNKALRHRLLAVPAMRDRYLAYVGDIADKWLDWNRLGPLVERYRTLIAADVARDTRKLDATEPFTTGVYGDGMAPPAATTIKGFADQRRAFLLSHPDIIAARARR